MVVSLQDLTPNPQDNLSIYLEKLYRLQAERNVCHISVAPVKVQPPAFSPPLYAVWTNALWFLSLVISLTCATLATLLQQWARRYIRITQLRRRTPERRARIHAFFAIGVEKFHVAWAIEALPAVVHLSLFIFFAGLLVFLFNINHAVCSAVVCWVALSSTVYACITFMPIFWHDSPYYTPLSSTVWLLYTATKYVLAIPKFIRFRHHPILPTWRCLCKSVDHYRGWISGEIERATEETISNRSSQINKHIMEWTGETLSEVDSVRRILETIPDFYQSVIVKPLGERIPEEAQERMGVAVGGGNTPPVVVLGSIRHLYIDLHRGTKAAPTAFSTSTSDTDEVLDHPSSYPYCYSRHVSDPAEKGGHAGDPMLTTSPASLSYDDDPAEARIAVTPPTAYDTTSFHTNGPDSAIPYNGDEPSLISEHSAITTSLPPSRSLTQRSRGGSPLP